MSKRIALLLLAATLLMLLSRITTPAAAADISGNVINGTNGAPLPEGLEILMLVIENETGTVLERRRETIATNGYFIFSNAMDGTDVAYRMVVENTGYSPFVDIAPGEGTENIMITLWEQTQDPSILRVGDYNVLIASVDGRERLVEVLAAATIRNTTDRVWVVKPIGDGITGLDLLRFNLPEGYSELTVETTLPAGSVLEINTGFALTTPVPPGEHSILIHYFIPYEGELLQAPFRLAHGADNVRFLLPKGAGNVNGNRLQYEGISEAPSGEDVINFDTYTGVDYSPGDSIELEISGLPQPAFINRIQDSLNGRVYALATSGISGVLLLFAIVLVVLRRQSVHRKMGARAIDINYRHTIVKQIAELDDLYDEGTIQEEDYQKRRKILKEAILNEENAAVDQGKI